jgi:hypothetical protein
LIVAIAMLAGCGDDGGSAPNPPPAAANRAGAAPTAAGANAKNQLPEKLHVEDRVRCTIPEQPSDPENGKCDPKAPSCGDRLYCMTLASGSYCEPCPERDGIRHAFRERDFAGEQNRDPFEPRGTLTTWSGDSQVPPTEKCRRDDQFVATSYSYVDLKLVGIVAQGTQRKVLMMGGPLGYIIKRGDCVGKEKAVVTDIGTGYITFQVDPDPLSMNQRPATTVSIQLNPKQLAANDPNEQPQSLPRTTIAPVVPPPPMIPPAAQRPSGPTGAGPAPSGAVAPGAAAPPTGTTPGGVPLVVPASPPAAAPNAGSTAAPSAPPAPARVFVPAAKP